MKYRDRVKELRRVKASEIVGAAWNWRMHGEQQRDALAGSLEELGYFDPLITRELPDKRLELIDGHARRDLLHERIGPDTLVPCIVTDLTEEEAKRANLVKDPLSAMASVDAAKLDALMAEAQFVSPAVQAMLDDLAAANGLSDEEAKLVDVNTQPPPTMTWVLIGVPTVRYGEFAETVTKWANSQGVIVETTVTSGGDNGDARKDG